MKPRARKMPQTFELCHGTHQVVLDGSTADRRPPPLPLVHQVRVQAVGLSQGQGLLILLTLNLWTRKRKQGHCDDVVDGD